VCDGLVEEQSLDVSFARCPKEWRAQCAGAIAVRLEGQSTGARDCFVAKGIAPARVSEAWEGGTLD
jgi:hypothetical protein